MIELIAIYLTSKNIAEIAREKGLSSSLWRLIAILAWIFFEVIGVLVGLLIFGRETGLLLYVTALIGALLGVLVVRKIIENRPDIIKESQDLLDN